MIGAFGGLWVTGKTLNIFSLIGIIMLTGLVSKNAILLVDYTNTLRKEGKGVREALLAAGPVRLRPILMTSATLMCSMLPLAIGAGPGGEVALPAGHGHDRRHGHLHPADPALRPGALRRLQRPASLRPAGCGSGGPRRRKAAVPAPPAPARPARARVPEAAAMVADAGGD